jgi:glycosyltransferase involved in cell wall biosynthesis
MRLSVIIPCYNELSTIDSIVGAVNRAPYPDKKSLSLTIFQPMEREKN